MPFDDLKTQPEGFATTPTTQPVAWAVSDRDDGELLHVTLDRDEAVFAAGGNAFALIPLYTLGCRLSGVAAAAATAADVARSVAETPDERHDAATCCAERQEPDVGEGWRELGPDEILQQGDEAYVGHDQPQWVPTFCVGQRVADVGNGYRRRVTPSKPVEIDGDRPDVGEGWREIRTGEHAEHLAKGDWVQDSNGCWEPIHGFMIGGFGSPSHRYIRRRVTPDEKPLGAFLDEENNTLRAENAALRSEVERLRLTQKERKAVAFAEQNFVYFKNQARTLKNLLKRLGGGS